MSQVENIVTSSVKPKRQYRKGNPKTASERQMSALARKRVNHKEVKIFVRDSLKESLMEMCKADGMTQAEMIEKWIESESSRRKQEM